MMPPFFDMMFPTPSLALTGWELLVSVRYLVPDRNKTGENQNPKNREPCN